MIDVTRRRRLVALLTEAAELEHALMCQYLYAAFSMKRHVTEGVSWQQLELMRRWEASIMLIARQEMEHLGLVANLLTAIGEAPWLTRPNLPLSPRHYDLEVESKLERLTEETLLRFALFEIPAELTPAEQAALGEGIDAARYQTIGRALRRDRRAVRAARRGAVHRPARRRAGDDGRDPGAAARDLAAEHGPHLRRHARARDRPGAAPWRSSSRSSSKARVRPDSTAQSHFTRFLQVLAEFRAERSRDPGFDPARAVTAHPDPHAIHDVRTRRVSVLFDDAYAAVLLLLMRFFGHSDERTAELTGLQRAAFFPMMTTVIRPLGRGAHVARRPGPAGPRGRRSASRATSRCSRTARRRGR